MKRLLFLTAFIAIFNSCSKSTNTPNSPQFKYNGEWHIVDYTLYDHTGGTTKGSWGYDTLILNKETAKALQGSNEWGGSVRYWANKLGDSISIKINGQPEMTGDIEKWNDGITIIRKENGYFKESWNLKKQ